jgi:hypothetical protein
MAYYYKSKVETFEDGKIIVRYEQKRGNYKTYNVVPVTIGGLSRTHKIIRNVNHNDRIQSNVMDIAYKANRANNQLLERKAKR